MSTEPKKQTRSAKEQIKNLGLPMDAATMFRGLELCGLMEQIPYQSTTGSGEEKHYLSLTAKGEAYGRNKPSGWHEFKTEPTFYTDKFAEAYTTAAYAILMHAQAFTGITVIQEGEKT